MHMILLISSCVTIPVDNRESMNELYPLYSIEQIDKNLCDLRGQRISVMGFHVLPVHMIHDDNVTVIKDTVLNQYLPEMITRMYFIGDNPRHSIRLSYGTFSDKEAIRNSDGKKCRVYGKILQKKKLCEMEFRYAGYLEVHHIEIIE